MSNFNKLFIGSAIVASILAVAHTGAWAWSSAQVIDATQRSEVASMVALTFNASLGLPSTSATADSCAKASATAAQH